MFSIDLIVLIILLLFAVYGYFKGLIASLSSLAALVIGAYAAFFFSDITAGFISSSFDFHSKYLKLIAFIITLILVMIIVLSLGKLLEKLINILVLTFFNRLLGALFGIVKAGLILSLILMLLNFFSITEYLISKEKQTESWFYPRIESFAPLLFKQLDVEKSIQDITKPPKQTQEDEGIVL